MNSHRFGSYVLTRLMSADRGAGMVEYALLVLLVGIALIGAVALFTAGLSASFNDSAAQF